MRLDLLIASASAGLLVYSGRLLAPSARLRPEDIIAYEPFPIRGYLAGPDPFGRGMGPWPVFPENDIQRRVRNVRDSKVGFDFLVYGTIGSVLTVIAGAVGPSWSTAPLLDAGLALVAGTLAYGAGWWWTDGSGWYERRERRLLVHCFFAWLEREVGDPKAKGYEFGLTVISIARTSGFTLTEGLGTTPDRPRTEADDNAAARRVVALAREHGYQWRRPDFRKWADEVRAER